MSIGYGSITISNLYDGQSYSLISSAAAVVQGVDGVYSPSSITIHSKRSSGDGDLIDYACRFKIEAYDGVDWFTVYESAVNEVSTTYILPSETNTVSEEMLLSDETGAILTDGDAILTGGSSSGDDLILVDENDAVLIAGPGPLLTVNVLSGVVQNYRVSMYKAGGFSELLDQQTIPVVSDGINGTEPYTVVLTNENHTFSGGTTAAHEGTAYCGVIAYHGSQRIPATITGITGMPTGMTTEIENNGTADTSFSVSVTEEMARQNGVLNVAITVDGTEQFNMVFTYSIALTGQKGDPGVSIESVTDWYAVSDSNTTPPDLESDDWTSDPSEVTMTEEDKYLWNYEVVTKSDGDSDVTDPRVIGVYGATGATGADGVSITGVTNYYATNNDDTTPPDDEDFDTTPDPVSASAKYLWNYEQVTFSEGNPYTSPKHIVGMYAEDGAPGINSATITLYQRAASTPTKPSGVLTYTFSTGVISGELGNWAQTIPSGTNPVYVIMATAAATTATDTIAGSEFSNPIVLAQNGGNGYDGYNQATIYLYQRKSTAPTLPSSAVTYTFSTGSLSSIPTGWSRTIPTTTANEDPCWVTSAAAVSRSGTYSIPTTAWAEATKIAEDGYSPTATVSKSGKVATISITDKNGTTTKTVSDGADGVSITGVTNYYLATNASSGVTPSTSGWTTAPQDVDSTHKYLWNYESISYSSGNPTTSTPCIIGVFGKDGDPGSAGKGITSITEYYKTSTSNTTAPADNEFSTTFTPTDATNKYLWNYELTTYTDNSTSKSTKRVIGTHGDKGEKGDTPTVTSTVTEYQQSTSGTTVPTGTWESSPPAATAGQFIWARITVTYDTGDTAVSYTVAKNGTNGTSATTYRLIVTASAIKKTANGVYDPTAITLTGKAQTGSDSMANYSGRFIIETTTNNSTWTTKYTSSTNEATTTYTIPANVVAVRCSLYKAGGTTQLLDQQTIPVVTDGSDAYTVLLTNESHSFAGGTAAAVDGSVDCGVIAYKGATQVAPTIGTITGMPSGMTVAISNNSTTSAKFTVTATSSMTTPSGTLTVPVTVDGKSFTKNFSYSLSRKGDSPVVTANKSGGTTTISVDGVTQATIYDGVTYNFIVSHAAINRGADGSFNPTAISLQAQKLGEDSATTAYAGRFTIEVTDNYFWYPLYTSASNESSKTYTLPSGDFTVLLADYDGTALTDYDGKALTGLIGHDELCAFRVTLYAAGGTTTLLNQQIIPVTSDGIGVVSMTTQYYLSTSASEPVGGSWSDTNPAYVDGRTYWTREKTVWTNGETTYSDPVKDQGLTDSCANALAASIAAENAMTAANGKNKVIHANKPSTWPTTGYSDGDTWFAKDEGYKMYTFSNGAWVAEQLNTQAIAVNAIKASNIDAGAITADKIAANAIDTKQITLGGSSHDGKITMMSASNKVLAVWDKTGLTMYDGTGATALSEDVIGSWTASGIDIKKGTIAGATINGATINGGTLTLGGSSSGTGRSGSIAMYNSSNKLIGTWDSSGLTMYDGNGTSLGSWTSSGIIVNQGTITASAVSGGTLDFDPTNFEVENFSADLITAGTLVVGGSSSTSGADQIIVKNSQDQTIGTWGASGISVYGASITGGVIKTTDTQHAMFDYHVDTYEIDNSRESPTADRYMHIAGGSISSVLAGTDPSSASNIKGQIYPVSIIRKQGTSTIDTLDGWYIDNVLYAPNIITAGGIVPGRDAVSGMIRTFLSAYSTTTDMNTAISNSATAVMNWVGQQGYITDGIDASTARSIARAVVGDSYFRYTTTAGYSDEQTGCRVYYHSGLPIATMVFSYNTTYKNSVQITNTSGPTITSTTAFLPAATNVYFYTNQGLLRLSSSGKLTAATDVTIATNTTIRGSVTYLTQASYTMKYITAPSE